MAPLATAFVRLRADSSVLAADARRDAAVAGEQAGASMGRSMSSGLTRTFKALAGIGAATGVIELGKKVLDLADAFEISRSRAETVTQNIGQNFKAIEPAVTSADNALAKFGFTAADTEGAFSTLEAVTKDPAKAMGDLSLAADIARGRNISLSESVSILSRIETGHVSMLSRLGIATKDAAGKTLTQAEALQMLTNLYGGAASRYADTFAGKQAALRAELGNSATEIGVSLLPAFVDLAGVVQHEVLPPLIDAAHWFDEHKRTIEPLVGIVLKLAFAWKTYNLAVKGAKLLSESFGGAKIAGAAATAPLAAEAVSAAKPVPVFVTNWEQLPPEAGPKLPGGLGALPLAFVGGVPDMAPPRDTPKDVQALIPEAQKLIASGRAVTQATPAMKQALAIVRAQMQQTGASATALSTKETSLGTATVRTADQLEAAAKKNLDLSSAQDSLRQAFQQAAQTAADSGKALTGNSDAALANRDAVRQEAAAIFAVIDAMKQHGASATAQAASLSILEQALEINATKTYGDKAAVDALLGSLGLVPAAAQNAAGALNAYMSEQISADAALDPRRIAALTAQDKNTTAALKAQQSLGAQVAQSFTSGYTPVVAKTAASAAKTAAKAVSDAFTAAKDKMHTDFDSIKSEMTSLTDSISGFGSLSNGGLRTDSNGNSGPLAFMRAQAGRLKQFASLYTRLDKAGLDRNLLSQFAQAGPDAIPAMQQIIAGGSREVKQLNRLEGQILSSSRTVAAQQTALDNSGLIHSDLKKLPRQIANDLARELKNLHIITDTGKLDARTGAHILAST